jgi:hypothetical protein
VRFADEAVRRALVPAPEPPTECSLRLYAERSSSSSRRSERERQPPMVTVVVAEEEKLVEGRASPQGRSGCARHLPPRGSRRALATISLPFKGPEREWACRQLAVRQFNEARGGAVPDERDCSTLAISASS